jgi:chemotaxis protein methyltransferase CheR
MAPVAPEKYLHVKFQGAASARLASIDRLRRQARIAPTASIFARSEVGGHAPVLSPADQLLLDAIFARAKLHAGAYRSSALGRRIPACLRALRARSPAEAIRCLEQDEHALDLALNALLIGVTTFFRDEAVFHHLSTKALPALLRESPAPRVLSVGCSDGSEAYSLAMALMDLGCESFDICGIDCRPRAIHRARKGIYHRSTLASLSQRQAEAYLVVNEQRVQVRRALRDRVQFECADAFVHVMQGPYDLIACRNFVIYLEHPAAARLWRRLHHALRPGGLLLAGKAEHPTAGFLRAGPCLFRKAVP